MARSIPVGSIPKAILRKLEIDGPPTGKRKASAARSAKVKANIRKGKRAANGIVTWCKTHGLPVPVMEHRFHPQRRWLIDVAWPDLKLGVELQGGVFVRGAHARGTQYRKDCEKLNTAQLMGWRLLWFTYPDLNDGSATAMIREALESIKSPPCQPN